MFGCYRINKRGLIDMNEFIVFSIILLGMLLVALGLPEMEDEKNNETD